jgi:hypothetical protein
VGKYACTGGFDDRPKIARVFVGKLATIAYREDPMPRLVPKQKSWECHRHGQAFQVPRRRVDNQASDFASADEFEVVADEVNVPVRQERGARVKRLHAALQKALKILAQHGGKQSLVTIAHNRFSS